MRHLDAATAVGVDGIPYAAFLVNEPWWVSALLAFLNLVFAYGIAPSIWKSSIVAPLFKAGDASESGNYRPISLL